MHDARSPIGEHQKILGIEHIDKVIGIDQKPIGRTPRSNPATYTKVFDSIRELYASTPRGARLRLRRGSLLVQRQGRSLRGLLW